MMRQIWTLFFILILPTVVISQSFKAGFQFGVSATQVDGDNLTGYNKAGLYGGGYVNHPVGNKDNIQMEISFIQKGSRKNAKPSDGIYDSYLMRLNYVEVPLLYIHNFRKYFAVQAGFSTAYLISSTEKDNYGTFDNSSSVPSFRNFELAGMVGMSIRFKEKWDFVFRFSYSLIPIRDTPIFSFAYYNKPQHNNVLITALQYHFN